MTIRVRSRTRPGDCSKDVDFGPGHAERHNWQHMAKTVDDPDREAIQLLRFAASQRHTTNTAIGR